MDRFRSFIDSDTKNSLCSEMAVGKGSSTLSLPITQPMANLLTCLPGDYLRARALDWIKFDGLKQAILGRQKLCDLVNNSLGIIKFPQANNASQPYQRAMGEARDAFGNGRDPWQRGDPIMPCDLFSQKARQRVPGLADWKSSDGLFIDEYYDKHFEPTEMWIDKNPGQPIHIDLQFLKQFISARGMQPFKYGGVDGYLQTVEKGDDLPAHEKQFYDDNEQFGPDLTLDASDDDDSESLVNGIPTLHLVGGSINHSDNRSVETIKAMKHDFAHIASQIEDGKDIADLNPNVVNQIRNILSIKNLIHKAELGLDKGKGRIAAKMGVPTATHSSEGLWKLPEGIDQANLKTIFQLFQTGLSQPTNPKSLASIPEPNKFGPEWNGDGPEPDGWHRMLGDKVIIKLSKADQDAVFDYMVRQPYQSTGSVRLRPDWIQIPELRGKVGPDSGRFMFSTILNSGEKANPKLSQNFKRVMYSMKDVAPSAFIKDGVVEKIPVEDIQNPGYDKTLSKLWDSGYRWELHSNDKVEQQTGTPNWNKRDYAVLALKSSKFRVVRENDKFFLLVPTGNVGKSSDLSSHGDGGNASLAGGRTIAGGMGGHVFTQPAGPNTYNELLEKLMNGELGERGGANSEEELPCVRQAIKQALNKYGQKKHGEAAQMNWSNGSGELLNWAVQGLKACSGTPQFQVGFLTQAQIEHVLRWNAETQYKYAEKGWGIDALLSKYGIEDAEDKEDIIQAIIDEITKNPIIDISFLTPHQQAAIGDNAFKARVYMIAGFLFNMMTKVTSNKAAKAQRAERGESQLAGKEIEGGNAGSVLDTGRKVSYDSDSEWEAPEEEKRRLNLGKLRSGLGLSEPEQADLTPQAPTIKFPPKDHDWDDVATTLSSDNPVSAPRLSLRTTSKPRVAKPTPVAQPKELDWNDFDPKPAVSTPTVSKQQSVPAKPQMARPVIQPPVAQPEPQDWEDWEKTLG